MKPLAERVRSMALNISLDGYHADRETCISEGCHYRQDCTDARERFAELSAIAVELERLAEEMRKSAPEGLISKIEHFEVQDWADQLAPSKDSNERGLMEEKP